MIRKKKITIPVLVVLGLGLIYFGFRTYEWSLFRTHNATEDVLKETNQALTQKVGADEFSNNYQVDKSESKCSRSRQVSPPTSNPDFIYCHVSYRFLPGDRYGKILVTVFMNWKVNDRGHPTIQFLQGEPLQCSKDPRNCQFVITAEQAKTIANGIKARGYQTTLSWEDNRFVIVTSVEPCQKDFDAGFSVSIDPYSGEILNQKDFHCSI